MASIAGYGAILGCAIMAVAVMIGDWLVPGNDMVADTISAMAAGPMNEIVDTGIVAFSVGLLLLGPGTAVVHPGGWKWSVGSVLLLGLGVTVFLVGFRNEYGDGDAASAENDWHMVFVYVLGVLFALVPWLMAEGADRMRDSGGRWLRGAAILWVLTAPWFFFMPDGYDGLYERLLGLVAFLFVIALSRRLIEWSRHGDGTDPETGGD